MPNAKITTYAIFKLKENRPFVDSLFKELKFLYEKRGDNAEPIIRRGISMLLALLFDMQSDAKMTASADLGSFAKQTLLFLNCHFRESLQLENIAEEFHVSVSHLSHEFARQFGISPINYLINRRVFEARWLLASSSMTFQEIAYYLGYENVNHFKNIFTKRVGVAPYQYREAYSDLNRECLQIIHHVDYDVTK